MLRQFELAAAFGEAFLEMIRDSDLRIQVLGQGAPILAPTLTVRTDRFVDAWTAFYAWHQNRPRGDDLAPAIDPPAEIRVPPDVGD